MTFIILRCVSCHESIAYSNTMLHQDSSFCGGAIRRCPISSGWAATPSIPTAHTLHTAPVLARCITASNWLLFQLRITQIAGYMPRTWMHRVVGSVLEKSGQERMPSLRTTTSTGHPSMSKQVGRGALPHWRGNPRRYHLPKGNKAEWRIKPLPTEVQGTASVRRLMVPILLQVETTLPYPLQSITTDPIADELRFPLLFDASVLFCFSMNLYV